MSPPIHESETGRIHSHPQVRKHPNSQLRTTLALVGQPNKNPTLCCLPGGQIVATACRSILQTSRGSHGQYRRKHIFVLSFNISETKMLKISHKQWPASRMRRAGTTTNPNP
jgi:hypothetical protein